MPAPSFSKIYANRFSSSISVDEAEASVEFTKLEDDDVSCVVIWRDHTGGNVGHLFIIFDKGQGIAHLSEFRLHPSISRRGILSLVIQQAAQEWPKRGIQQIAMANPPEHIDALIFKLRGFQDSSSGDGMMLDLLTPEIDSDSYAHIKFLIERQKRILGS